MPFVFGSVTRIESLQSNLITAVAVGEKPRDTPDSGYAYAGQLVYLAVGFAFAQQFYDPPAVGERLQFRGRTQIAKETPALIDTAKRQYCAI